MEVGVIKCRVAQAKTKFVDWSRVVLVEVPVVNEVALREFDLRRSVAIVELGQELSAIVLAGLAPGERALATRVHTAVEYIGNGISGLLAGQTSPDDGSDVGVLVPRVDEDGAHSVHDHDGVVAVLSDGVDDILPVLPEGEVVPVTLIAVHADETLTCIGVDEDQRDTILLAQG